MVKKTKIIEISLPSTDPLFDKIFLFSTSLGTLYGSLCIELDSVTSFSIYRSVCMCVFSVLLSLKALWLDHLVIKATKFVKFVTAETKAS